jgi:hypothetical protein
MTAANAITTMPTISSSGAIQLTDDVESRLSKLAFCPATAGIRSEPK